MVTKKKIMRKKVVERPKVTVKPPTPDNSNRLWGWILLGIGLYLLIRHSFGFDILKFWPLVMVAAGAYILWYKK